MAMNADPVRVEEEARTVIHYAVRCDICEAEGTRVAGAATRALAESNAEHHRHGFHHDIYGPADRRPTHLLALAGATHTLCGLKARDALPQVLAAAAQAHIDGHGMVVCPDCAAAQ
jgi:hypothetical protein